MSVQIAGFGKASTSFGGAEKLSNGFDASFGSNHALNNTGANPSVGSIWGVALPLIASALGKVYDYRQNAKITAEQRAYNESQQDKANAYNSPQAQINRLMSAGLSETQARYTVMGSEPVSMSPIQQDNQYQSPDFGSLGDVITGGMANDLTASQQELDKFKFNKENALRTLEVENTIKQTNMHIKEIAQNMSIQKDTWQFDRVRLGILNGNLDLEQKTNLLNYDLQLWSALAEGKVSMNIFGEPIINPTLLEAKFKTSMLTAEDLYYQAVGNRNKAQQMAKDWMKWYLLSWNMQSQEYKNAVAQGDFIGQQTAGQRISNFNSAIDAFDKSNSNPMYRIAKSLGIDVTKPLGAAISLPSLLRWDGAQLQDYSTSLYGFYSTISHGGQPYPYHKPFQLGDNAHEYDYRNTPAYKAKLRRMANKRYNKRYGGYYTLPD